MVRVYRLSKVPSPSEYVEGLTAIQPRIKDTQLGLLQEQYHAPSRTVTAAQLAELVGIKGGRPVVNSLYGRLGHLFCDAIGFEPYKNTDDKYCCAMIHRPSIPLSIKEVKALLDQSQYKTT